MLKAEPDGSRHAWGILSLTSPASEKHILVYSLGWKNVVFYQKYRGLSEQSFFLIKISPSQGKIWLFFGGGKYPQKSKTSNKMQHRRMGPGGETRSRRAPSCCSRRRVYLCFYTEHLIIRTFIFSLLFKSFEWKFLDFDFSGGETNSSSFDQNSNLWNAVQQHTLTCPFPAAFPNPFPSSLFLSLHPQRPFPTRPSQKQSSPNPWRSGRTLHTRGLDLSSGSSSSSTARGRCREQRWWKGFLHRGLHYPTEMGLGRGLCSSHSCWAIPQGGKQSYFLWQWGLCSVWLEEA